MYRGTMYEYVAFLRCVRYSTRTSTCPRHPFDFSFIKNKNKNNDNNGTFRFYCDNNQMDMKRKKDDFYVTKIMIHLLMALILKNDWFKLYVFEFSWASTKASKITIASTIAATITIMMKPTNAKNTNDFYTSKTIINLLATLILKKD